MTRCLFCEFSENLTRKGKLTKYLGCHKKKLVLNEKGKEEGCDRFHILQIECVVCGYFRVSQYKEYHCAMSDNGRYEKVDGSGCSMNDKKYLDKNI